MELTPMNNMKDLTRAELLSQCEQFHLTKYKSKTKPELIELLLSHMTPEHVTNSDATVYEDENKSKDAFVFQTMLTCIGNKRKLVRNISEIVKEVAVQIGKMKLNIVDGFAGSSVVSRELSYLADHLYSNDLELYSHLMAQCYLVVPTTEQQVRIAEHIEMMNYLASNGPFVEGIVCKLYAPKDTNNIQLGERCFYTRENALIIDTLRLYIDENVEPELAVYCLVPLLNRASIHTNTAGVFKGFYKKGELGWFGGSAENALSRIMKPIQLDMPVWNNQEPAFQAHCVNKDINAFVTELPDNIDIMYLDPPYNQHPYGSNYFMLNVIAKNEEPLSISDVSGIPTDWNKSDYNKHIPAVNAMRTLIANGLQKSKYLLISYNNEGIIDSNDWNELFAPYCVKKYEIKYDTFKGCRNLKNRDNKVMEIMYLVSLS